MLTVRIVVNVLSQTHWINADTKQGEIGTTLASKDFKS